MWLSADMFIRCAGIRVWMDGEELTLPAAPENNRYSERESAGKMRIEFLYETITVPSTQVSVMYEVGTDGAMLVRAHYFGKSGRRSCLYLGCVL